MFLCDAWKDYEVLDTGDGEKLERWGEVILQRPDPQTIWPKADPAAWRRADAVYHRSERGGGQWEFRRSLPDRWTVSLGELRFYVRPTGFKHTGLFPEQAANWQWMADRIRADGRGDLRILNLFGYTGGATAACAKAGAHVTHVDAGRRRTGSCAGCRRPAAGGAWRTRCASCSGKSGGATAMTAS